MEEHHILPRSLGGKDEPSNLIWLFPEEHYVAHRLLYLENPNNEKLAYAYLCLNSFGDSHNLPQELNIRNLDKLKTLSINSGLSIANILETAINELTLDLTVDEKAVKKYDKNNKSRGRKKNSK